MPEYTVRWEIQVSADSPLGAAREARSIQRDPDSMAGVFDVKPFPELGWEQIDLDQEDYADGGEAYDEARILGEAAPEPQPELKPTGRGYRGIPDIVVDGETYRASAPIDICLGCAFHPATNVYTCEGPHDDDDPYCGNENYIWRKVEPEPQPEPKPELRVGQVWLDRLGRTVEIVSTDVPDNDYPVEGRRSDTSRSYTKQGWFFKLNPDGKQGSSPSDLVELVSDAPPAPYKGIPDWTHHGVTYKAAPEKKALSCSGCALDYNRIICSSCDRPPGCSLHHYIWLRKE